MRDAVQSSEEMVSVPKGLLLEVLDAAECNSESTQSEFAVSDEDERHYMQQRAQIDRLRAYLNPPA